MLSATINRYCWITVRYLPPFFAHRSRIVWSKIERVKDNRKIEHPAVRACLARMGIRDGVSIHHDGDLPARSGIGSSSAFTVGLLNALDVLVGKEVPDRFDLANRAIKVERGGGETVGAQDQIATAIGGFNEITFDRDGTFSLKRAIIASERLTKLERSLMLVFTGITRDSSRPASIHVKSLKRNEQLLQRMAELTRRGKGLLEQYATSLEDFGELLGEGWSLKRQLGPHVSTPEIDDIYDAAISAGAIGGKLLGAGGGGFMLLCVDPENRPMVQRRLKHLVQVPFEFENEGSRIVFGT